MFTLKKAKHLLMAASVVAVSFSSAAMADEMSDWMFEQLDANSDGFITLKEFRGSYLDGEGVDWTVGLRPACTEAVMKASDPDMAKIFKEMDLSKDGKIGKGEFATQGVALYNQYWDKTFEAADKDNSGKISEKEFIKQLDDHYENLKKEYAENRIPSECKADLNELYASNEEIMTAKAYFKTLDGNNDGNLSKTEFTGQEK